MNARAVGPTVSSQKYFSTPDDKAQMAVMLERIEAAIRSDYADFMRRRASAKAEEPRAKKAQGEALFQSAEEKKPQAEDHAKKAAEATAQRLRILKILSVNTFCEIFHGKVKLPPAMVEAVFARYLDQGKVISILQDPVTKEGYFEARTTVSFARYLAENPGKVVKCDFRIFKEKILDNMRDIAQILAEPTCSVKAVWINSGISPEAKANLEAAKLARGEALTINYV